MSNFIIFGFTFERSKLDISYLSAGELGIVLFYQFKANITEIFNIVNATVVLSFVFEIKAFQHFHHSVGSSFDFD